MPLKLAAKVLELSRIVEKDDGFFYDGNRVVLLDGHDFFGINKASKREKKSALLLDKNNDGNTALLVDEVIGFMNEKNVSPLRKVKFLDLYGFNLIDFFAVFKGRLVFAVDENAVQKRLEGSSWES